MKKTIFCLLIAFSLIFTFPAKPVKGGLLDPAECGEYFAYGACNCANKVHVGWNPPIWCCGWYDSTTGCHASPPPTAAPTATPTLVVPIPPVDQELLDDLNPLKLFSTKADQLSTPGGIISEVLKYAFPIAGMILFGMLVLAGFKMLTGATNSKNMDEGKQIITTAIVGFIILFASYWIIQLVEVIFGIEILGI
ncbi:MAG: hypothetical protein GX559_03405 [Candidatus Pacebacteria bacterium]|nr:hypothetical protein [Candidatus Paceibacterota bacterium]